MTFTTGTDGGETDPTLAFEKVDLPDRDRADLHRRHDRPGRQALRRARSTA